VTEGEAIQDGFECPETALLRRVRAEITKNFMIASNFKICGKMMIAIIEKETWEISFSYRYLKPGVLPRGAFVPYVTLCCLVYSSTELNCLTS